VVDIGAKTTSINIYRGAKLLMPRQVPLGGELFTKAIADALTVGLQEAETMKRERLTIPENVISAQDAGFATPGSTQEFQPYNPFSDEPLPTFDATQAQASSAQTYGGINPFDPMAEDLVANPPGATAPANNTPVPAPVTDPIFNAIAAVLDEFVAEIRRSVDYFRSRGGDLDVILLCGGGAKMRGLANYVGRSLGLACDTYDPLRRLNVNARKLPPAFTQEHSAEFAVAVGNALYIFFD
jgi:type IV pilus assembly protein PilM